MPTYKRFEDLPVWQTSAQFYERCDDFLTAVSSNLRPSARDQLKRAVLSVSNNIAEGFERGTTNELLAFIYIARGSAGEAQSMLALFSRRPALANFKSEISNLIVLAESCSRQLRAWADSLQNSAIAGPRHSMSKPGPITKSASRARPVRRNFKPCWPKICPQTIPCDRSLSCNSLAN